MLDRLLQWVQGEETTELGLPQDPEERAKEVRDLGDSLHHGSETEQLVTASLEDDSPLVRAAALDAIATNRVYVRELSAEPLLDLLDDTDPGVRAGALELFGSEDMLAQRMPVAPVIDCLGDTDRTVRLAAAQFFEKTVGGEGLDRMYDLVREDDIGVRAAAATALAHGMQGAPYELDQQQAVELVEILAATKREPGVSEDKRLARESILDALSRGSFVSGLSVFDDEQTTTIVSELDADAPEIRANATTVLGHIEHDRVLEPLLAALEDDEPTVRIHAMRALERAGTTTGSHIERIEDLTEGALSSDIEADPRVTEALETALDRESDPEVIDQCLESLGRLGDPDVVDSLVEYLDSDDSDRRRKVVTALRDIAPVAVDPLTERLRNDPSEDVRKQAAGALSDPNVDAIEDLRRAYETDDSDQVRASALSAMHTADADTVVDIAIDALDDESVSVRNSAAFALGELGVPEAREPLESAAENDSNPNVRESAERALERL